MEPSELEPTNCRLAFGFALETTTDLFVDLPRASGPPDMRLVVRLVDEPKSINAELVYASEPEKRSAAAITAYRAEAAAVVRFRSTSQFTIHDDLIECELLSADYDYLVPIQFLGIVMALWMERRGYPVLHSSATSLRDRAVAFLATKRGGKTSLAAAFLQAGFPMLSDDLLPIDPTGTDVLARPAYPQLRMEPDVANHFLGRWEHLPILHPDFEKRRVPVSLLGVHESRPVPLACIYLPERVDSGPIEITPIPGAGAVVELLRGSFLPKMVALFGLESKRLPGLASVANKIPMKHLRYPSGLDRLPEVVAAVENDLGAPPQRTSSQ